MDKPEDLKIGDHLEFTDPFSGDIARGKIAEIQIENPGDWSQVDIWIDMDVVETHQGIRITQTHFYTEMFSDGPSYWKCGSPEAEATPQERGCYSVRKLEEGK